MVEVEPVLVGLLAAAFAFMYPQLMRLVNIMIEEVRAEGVYEAVLKMVWATVKGRVSLDEKEFVIEFNRMWMAGVGRIMRFPVSPLVVYMLSLCVLVAGYAVSDYWSFYEWIVFEGVLLLVASLVSCGGYLAWIQSSVGKAVEKFGDDMKGMIMEVSEKVVE